MADSPVTVAIERAIDLGTGLGSSEHWKAAGEYVLRAESDRLTVEAVRQLGAAEAAVDKADTQRGANLQNMAVVASQLPEGAARLARQLSAFGELARRAEVARAPETLNAESVDAIRRSSSAWSVSFTDSALEALTLGLTKALLLARRQEDASEARVAALDPRVHTVLQLEARRRGREEGKRLHKLVQESFAAELPRIAARALDAEPAEDGRIQRGLDRLQKASAAASPGLRLPKLRHAVSHALRPVAEAAERESTRPSAAAGAAAMHDASRRLLSRLRPAVDGVMADCARLQGEIERTRGALGDAAAGEAPAPRPSARCTSSAEAQSCLPSGQTSSSSNSRPQPTPSSESTGGRAMVVINCANVGFNAGFAALHQGGGDAGGRKRFEWEAVRRAFRFYDEIGALAQGVCTSRTANWSPIPSDLKARVAVCAPVDDEGDIDDFYTIRVAMSYGCQFVDNDNYRDWKHDVDKGSQEVRAWLRGEGAKLKVMYIFDANGRFVPSLYPPVASPSIASDGARKSDTR